MSIGDIGLLDWKDWWSDTSLFDEKYTDFGEIVQNIV